ncbi:MAG: 3-deoxy-manno-octulosonate cytidylyltransferase [Burkholderiaceae bacterium]
MSFTILIPARLASTRLPNKPLAEIGGVPMVVRVAQSVGNQATRTTPARVAVATDSTLVMAACEAHGVEAVLTRSDHASGSDRLSEACDLLALADTEIVVNVQGDEPLIDPALVDAVAALLAKREDASMSTAAHPIDTLEDFLSPNVVKVVLDASGFAAYFSRAPIPWGRDHVGRVWWRDGNLPAAALLRAAAPLRHIGIYGYRAGFLRRFPKLAQAPLEVAEALEQLRALWHGYRIAVHVTQDSPGPGIDTPLDLERVRQLFKP